MPVDLNSFIHATSYFLGLLVAAACKAYLARNVENLPLHISFIYLLLLLLL